MQLVHYLRLRAGCNRLDNLNDLEQVLGTLGNTALLSNLFITNPHFTDLIKVNKPINKKVPLNTLHKLPVGLMMDWEQNIGVSNDEDLLELGMVFAWNLKYFRRIFLYLDE